MNIAKYLRKILIWLNLKTISFVTAVLFLISMLPSWILAFIARPSGDDYGYSAASHQAWVHTYSLVEVLKAGLETTRTMYNSWNGNWFSVFIFTLMPEVFVQGSFWVVPIFWSLATIIATYYLLYELLTKHLGLKWYETLLVTTLILVMCYQWIPSSAIALYWYVGVIQYIMSHVIGLLLLAFLLKFLRTNRIRYIVYSVLGMIALGGSSYYSAFLVCLIYVLVFICYIRQEKRTGLIFIPMFSGLIAMYFQVISPGNAARVGEGFGFSIGRVFSTIFRALWQGLVSIMEYLQNKPIVFVLLLLIALILWECLSNIKLTIEFKYPLLWVGYMYGIYASMFTPEIYADTDISGGPPTMEYLTFIFMAVFSIIYVEGWLINKLKTADKIKRAEYYHARLTLPGILLCCLLIISCKSNLKETLFYESVEYITSGQAADYREQMDSQLEILLDDSIKEAYLCPTNPEQGPLMHMPVINNPNAFTNQVVAQFYGKDFVITVQE